jgi:hypothetical protein
MDNINSSFMDIELDPFELGWKAEKGGLGEDTNPWLNSSVFDDNHWKELEWKRGWQRSNEN